MSINDPFVQFRKEQTTKTASNDNKASKIGITSYCMKRDSSEVLEQTRTWRSPFLASPHMIERYLTNAAPI